MMHARDIISGKKKGKLCSVSHTCLRFIEEKEHVCGCGIKEQECFGNMDH